MRFGVNQNHWPETHDLVHGYTILRTFKPMASTWPVMPVNVPSLWSPRPDLAKVLAGDFDAAFTSAIRSAPGKSRLSIWHEAELAGVNATQMRAAHNHMHALVHQVNAKYGTNVEYGIVASGGAGRAWYVKGMDFIAGDVYDWQARGHPLDALNSWAGHVTDAIGTGWTPMIAETNTSVKAYRPEWFRTVFEWLKTRKSHVMITFWNPGGKLSGPFLPDDTKTIAVLNQIAIEAAKLP